MRVASKTGCPGALAPLDCEGAARINQRVTAAFSLGYAPNRRRKAGTSVCCAVSSNLREAVRSRHFGLLHGAMMTAPAPRIPRLSEAAFKTSCGEAHRTMMRRCGSSPIFCKPGAYGKPFSCAAKSSSNHRTGLWSGEARRTRAMTKPVAAPASPASSAKISCTAPRCIPSRKTRSISLSPKSKAEPCAVRAFLSPRDAMSRLNAARSTVVTTVAFQCS